MPAQAQAQGKPCQHRHRHRPQAQAYHRHRPRAKHASAGTPAMHLLHERKLMQSGGVSAPALHKVARPSRTHTHLLLTALLWLRRLWRQLWWRLLELWKLPSWRGWGQPRGVGAAQRRPFKCWPGPACCARADQDWALHVHRRPLLHLHMHRRPLLHLQSPR